MEIVTKKKMIVALMDLNGSQCELGSISFNVSAETLASFKADMEAKEAVYLGTDKPVEEKVSVVDFVRNLTPKCMCGRLSGMPELGNKCAACGYIVRLQLANDGRIITLPPGAGKTDTVCKTREEAIRVHGESESEGRRGFRASLEAQEFVDAGKETAVVEPSHNYSEKDKPTWEQVKDQAELDGLHELGDRLLESRKATAVMVHEKTTLNETEYSKVSATTVNKLNMFEAVTTVPDLEQSIDLLDGLITKKENFGYPDLLKTTVVVGFKRTQQDVRCYVNVSGYKPQSILVNPAESTTVQSMIVLQIVKNLGIRHTCTLVDHFKEKLRLLFNAAVVNVSAEATTALANNTLSYWKSVIFTPTGKVNKLDLRIHRGVIVWWCTLGSKPVSMQFKSECGAIQTAEWIKRLRFHYQIEGRKQLDELIRTALVAEMFNAPNLTTKPRGWGAHNASKGAV